LKIETLCVEIALRKYPFAAEQPDLTGLAEKRGVTEVRCIVIDKHSIRVPAEGAAGLDAERIQTSPYITLDSGLEHPSLKVQLLRFRQILGEGLSSPHPLQEIRKHHKNCNHSVCSAAND
jgi:hypothetical protein